MRQTLFRLGIEAVAWLCLPAVFLYVYVGHYAVAADAVLPHLRLIGLTLATFALARIAFVALARSPRAQRLGTAVLAATLFTILGLYYALALIGLEYWGRVISWELMKGYATHLPQLAETLGVSLSLAVAALALLYAALLAITWFCARLDWAPAIARRIPGRILWIGTSAAGVMVTIGFYNFLAEPPTRLYEPVSLTLFPSDGAWGLQGHAIDPLSVARLDRMADEVRASYIAPNGADRKNLVLIVADALRPDHMGVYGYERDTTPTLSRLARAGTVRKAPRVHAVCTSSACGLVGLASSKFVHEFHPRAITLHEVLKRYGYRIHLILGGDHTNFYGLKLAYGAADSYFDGARSRDMNDDRALVAQLAGFPDWDGSPVMFQFHLMSTHVLGKRDAEAGRFLPAATYFRSKGRDRDGETVGHGINYYDNGVAQADAIIQALLQSLAEKGYLRNAVVAITADHGEALGEHGLYMHGNNVREAALRIPFLLLSYGDSQRRPIDGYPVASQVDIAPTILAELGMPQPTSWSGAPLQTPVKRDFTYFQDRLDVGLVDHRDPQSIWKYWMNSATRREYAFDLSIDPREETNVVDQVPAGRLREWRLRVLAGAKVEKEPGAD